MRKDAWCNAVMPTKAKSKLFKKLPANAELTDGILVKFTVEDGAAVRNAAQVRQLSTSEFIRRTALGQKADLRYEAEIVLALGRCADTCKTLTRTLMDHETQRATDAEMTAFLAKATEAIQAAINAIHLVDNLN